MAFILFEISSAILSFIAFDDMASIQVAYMVNYFTLYTLYIVDAYHLALNHIHYRGHIGSPSLFWCWLYVPIYTLLSAWQSQLSYYYLIQPSY